jgi:hypothetical protein
VKMSDLSKEKSTMSKRRRAVLAMMTPTVTEALQRLFPPTSREEERDSELHWSRIAGWRITRLLKRLDVLEREFMEGRMTVDEMTNEMFIEVSN